MSWGILGMLGQTLLEKALTHIINDWDEVCELPEKITDKITDLKDDLKDNINRRRKE